MTIYTEVQNGKKVYYHKGPKGQKIYTELRQGKPLTGQRIPAKVYGVFIGPSTLKISVPIMGLTHSGPHLTPSQASKRVKRSQRPRTHRK